MMNNQYILDKYSDITIRLVDLNTSVELKCHRVVLASAADYFDKMFDFNRGQLMILMTVSNAEYMGKFIRSFYQPVKEDDWRTILEFIRCRHYLCLDINVEPLYEMLVPNEYFDLFVEVVCLFDITSDQRLIITIRRNLPIDYDLTKLSEELVELINSRIPSLLCSDSQSYVEAINYETGSLLWKIDADFSQIEKSNDASYVTGKLKRKSLDYIFGELNVHTGKFNESAISYTFPKLTTKIKYQNSVHYIHISYDGYNNNVHLSDANDKHIKWFRSSPYGEIKSIYFLNEQSHNYLFVLYEKIGIYQLNIDTDKWTQMVTYNYEHIDHRHIQQMIVDHLNTQIWFLLDNKIYVKKYELVEPNYDATKYTLVLEYGSDFLKSISNFTITKNFSVLVVMTHEYINLYNIINETNKLLLKITWNIDFYFTNFVIGNDDTIAICSRFKINVYDLHSGRIIRNFSKKIESTTHYIEC